MRALHGLCAILLSTTLAACGSTVQHVSSTADASTLSSGDGLSIGGDAASANAGTTLGGSTGSLSESNGTAAAISSESAVQSGAGRGPVGGSVTGVTATQIRVGYGTQKDADQAAAQFGLNAVFGDQEAQARAIVADINARGGVLGRKLVLVFHDDKTAADLNNPDTTASAMCTDWTQDRKVFAGINIVGSRNRQSLFACMAKARTPLLVSDLVAHTRHLIESYAPYLYAPGVATIDRWAPVWLQRLNARGYFQPWDTTNGSKGVAPVKVGVPYEDSDEGHRYLKIVTKALADVGRKVDDSFGFSTDAATALRQIPGMLLQFSSHNVTHVLLPASAYLITPVAERQRYRPRYAMTTLDGLSSLTVTTSPREQLTGTLGVGWLPASDVDAAHDPGDVSPNEGRCRRAMQGAGLDTSNRLTFTTQLIICDLFLFFAAALQEAGSISTSALQRGSAALLDKFPPVFTFVERYGPRRYDGANAARDVAFNDSCSCFVFLDRVNRPFRS